ncbi:MAG: hypothetical protein IPK88_00965 [Saprospiraceae bacterium]|nr:hypothetical protein [Candidatus Defluviibacterium haderslevense]
MPIELSFTIQKTSAFIYEYLTDMQKFLKVHPIITQIDSNGNDSYIIHETLKFLFIPCSFTYPVTIESKPFEKIVIMRATILKFTKIEMTFVLKAYSDFTVVEENIQIQSPFPIQSIIHRIFKKQHNHLFKNIEMEKI